MLAFLTRRLFGMAVVLAVMSFIVFMLIGLMPGDPIDIMIASNPDLTPADGERLKRLHGLDLPLWERYVNWLGGVFTGDLGFSRTYNRPVMEILLPRLGNTVILLGLSSIVAILVANFDNKDGGGKRVGRRPQRRPRRARGAAAERRARMGCGQGARGASCATWRT